MRRSCAVQRRGARVYFTYRIGSVSALGSKPGTHCYGAEQLVGSWGTARSETVRFFTRYYPSRLIAACATDSHSRPRDQNLCQIRRARLYFPRYDFIPQGAVFREIRDSLHARSGKLVTPFCQIWSRTAQGPFIPGIKSCPGNVNKSLLQLRGRTSRISETDATGTHDGVVAWSSFGYGAGITPMPSHQMITYGLYFGFISLKFYIARISYSFYNEIWIPCSYRALRSFPCT